MAKINKNVMMIKNLLFSTGRDGAKSSVDPEGLSIISGTLNQDESIDCVPTSKFY